MGYSEALTSTSPPQHSFPMRISSLVALAAFTVGTAQADVILSNLSSAPGSGTGFGAGVATQYKAFNFLMGGSDFTLTQVVLALGGTDPMPNPLVGSGRTQVAPPVRRSSL